MVQLLTILSAFVKDMGLEFMLANNICILMNDFNAPVLPPQTLITHKKRGVGERDSAYTYIPIKNHTQ